MERKVLLFVTKVLVLDWKSTRCLPSTLSTLTCTCKYEKVLVLDSSTSKSTWPQPWSARNVSMIQLARALKRKYYHFDEIFVTGCTGSCLPVQSVIKIKSKWRHPVSANYWIYLLVACREWTRLAQLCWILSMKSDPSTMSCLFPYICM